MTKRAGLIGTKIGNSSYYDEFGKSLPVTILKISECIVSGVKTIEKNANRKSHPDIPLKCLRFWIIFTMLQILCDIPHVNFNSVVIFQITETCLRFS